MHFSLPRLQYHPYYVPDRCTREKKRETEAKESRTGTEPHYICKSDSALNKILTDQSNTEGKGIDARESPFT